MKKYISLLTIIFLSMQFCFSQLKEEAEMHYNMAIKCYKNKNYKEAARILSEVISYYDTEDIKSWELLLKVYKKLHDKEKLEETKRAYKNIKNVIKLRKQKKLESLNPYEALLYGSIEQKISSCKIFEENKDKKAISYLIEALKDPFYNHYLGMYEVREKVADTLSKYGKEITDVLVENYNSTNDKTLRWWLLETIFRIYKDEKPDEKILKLFISGLNEKSKNIKIVSIKALTNWSISEPIKNNLNQLLTDVDEVKLQTIVSIGELGIYYDTKDEILKILNEKDKLLVNQTIITLKNLAQKNKEIEKDIVDTLINIAQDKTRPVSTRYYAIKALGNILKSDDLKKLQNLLEDENFWIKSAVASVLYHELEHMPEDAVEKRKDVLDELAIKLSLESEEVFEEARVAGINKGLKFLESIQKEDGSLPSFFPLGTTQLATICFLNQGYNDEYPFVKKAIDFMLRYRQKDGSFFCELDEMGKRKPVYQTSLAVIVLSRTKNPKYKDIIKDAINWLKEIQNPDGGFGYYKGCRSDITATKFALLALNDGYEYWGYKKTDDVFLKAAEYLKDLQNPDGGFGYTKEFKKHSYGSATADGLICLLLTGVDKKRIEKTISWIENNYTWDKNPFGEEKHYEYFIWTQANALNLAKKDVIKDKDKKPHLWFNEISKKLLSEQQKEGFWKIKQEPIFTTYFVSVLQLKKFEKYLSSF